MRTPRWLIVFYSLILVIGILMVIPNFFSKEFLKNHLSFLPDTRVTLGLDLRGGSYLVLEIDKESLKKDNMQNFIGIIRQNLRKKNIIIESIHSDKNFIEIKLINNQQKDEILSLLNDLNDENNIGTFQKEKPYDIVVDQNKIVLNITEENFNAITEKALEQSVEIIRRRVDEVGVAEPSIQKVGTDRIIVQLPGLQDPTQLRTLLGKTAKLSFHFVNSSVDKSHPPFGVSILSDYKDPQKTYPIDDYIALDGSTLIDAQAYNDLNIPGGQVKILFKLNNVGSAIFSDITEKNIGKAFAIILDNKVLTAPVIQSVIPNGSGQITGAFSLEEATQLSALLRAGALPAPLTVVEERSVGPDLGADAIKMGLYTGLVGFALVAIFMIILYGLWGLIADVALALHTILTLAALSLLGATLTLPGIAGIILGIGVAVDANILINERIKEETKRSTGAFGALDRGFKQAFSTIIDANITALIATALLYWQGTGPVRGFAVTMFLGIVISMFTDIILVRIIMEYVIKKWKMRSLSIQPLFSINKKIKSFRFMDARFLGLGLSFILSIASIVLFITPGLNYGIDFKGGIQMQVNFAQEPDLSKIRQQLQTLSVGEVNLQSIRNENAILLRIQRQEGGEIAQTNAADKVKNSLKKLYPSANFGSIDIVGPKVSGELARSGAIAVILAAIAMAVYIWWRFEWYFAIGAIVTLILDTTKMIGFFVLTQLDFNLTAIAALLTIIGYSINDKVVVYDRMRENLRREPSIDLRTIIDKSINQVFVRCIFTSMTTILAMLPMAIWGGSAVHNFAIPMVVGIIIATSSSIFIAAPILLFLGDWWRKQKKSDKISTSLENNL